ncbi:MAG: type II toxin-antitoxin system RelE/ParE family toxin [Planctomycetota bacterium]|nr:MAG: type II toxin-antitoxin system RelE/ParE family toxin [Planctomycetota bacterium]REK25342.1 MAG: type II toxin-antitoxin system RelE/ParE family toxin [Planctomycetota bacterium]REK43477.1 MAG: type II toxin-antitoxin system RelE/ParE family toxin [Planctomycetota bacterium]
MTKPFYTTAAQQDLADILRYIAQDKPGVALAWIEKIEAKCLSIADNPSFGELYRHLGEGVRASAVGRYVIFHREANNRVEILRIIPGDRDVTRLS